ncbi:TatD family hydrolase [Paenibacillus sp. p3-SID1389]|uniref:TatD family hydrolase n=1 Tax=Paenibacillus sp. p3-SID1389 TaxID=2916364 RepID=UPI0021A631CB|nr:TatD family hydrolase [Paenibacillus sp. p3-SID1389]MCT2197231.1 TatD family hydrolase [Paenibacillus sp. p3-SID1389]
MSNNLFRGLPKGIQLPFIDAHIHIDLYDEDTRERLLQELPGCGVEAIIAVSMHLASCKLNNALAERYPNLVRPAFGFHPEQPIPEDREIDLLLNWIKQHAEDMIAVGEVGLPYYARQEALQQGKGFELEPYVDLLEKFVMLAKALDKPIVMHAVYEDAELACDLLELHGVTKAHFHWFKGAESTVRRMADRGYAISFTPDIVYESKIQDLARRYPPEQVMAETDGPWPFEGPFAGQITHPRMTRHVALAWANLLGISPEEAAATLYRNTRSFYGL